jgi:hypothetical protein
MQPSKIVNRSKKRLYWFFISHHPR